VLVLGALRERGWAQEGLLGQGLRDDLLKVRKKSGHCVSVAVAPNTGKGSHLHEENVDPNANLVTQNHGKVLVAHVYHPQRMEARDAGTETILAKVVCAPARFNTRRL
jgi:hypothetical protein